MRRFCAVSTIFRTLELLALLSIPYYALYPDRHAHAWDSAGTPRQRERVAKWRALYARLTFRQRLRRCLVKRRRRRVADM